jgi:hypothetical protein
LAYLGSTVLLGLQNAALMEAGASYRRYAFGSNGRPLRIP